MFFSLANDFSASLLDTLAEALSCTISLGNDGTQSAGKMYSCCSNDCTTSLAEIYAFRELAFCVVLDMKIDSCVCPTAHNNLEM